MGGFKESFGQAIFDFGFPIFDCGFESKIAARVLP